MFKCSPAPFLLGVVGFSLFLSLCSADTICGTYTTVYCYGDDAYCCDYDLPQCCYHYVYVYSLWWFWFIWVMIFFFIASCIVCIRRRRRAAQYQTLRVGQPAYGTVVTSATTTAQYPQYNYGPPAPPAYDQQQSKPNAPPPAPSYYSA